MGRRRFGNATRRKSWLRFGVVTAFVCIGRIADIPLVRFDPWGELKQRSVRMISITDQGVESDPKIAVMANDFGDSHALSSSGRRTHFLSHSMTRIADWRDQGSALFAD